MEVSVLNRVVRVDITEKETFDKRLEESEQVGHVAMWGRAFWKGTASAEALRNNTEVSRAMVEGSRGRGRGRVRSDPAGSFWKLACNGVRWVSGEGVEQQRDPD